MQNGSLDGKIGVWGFLVLVCFQCTGPDTSLLRERISINEQWNFFKYDSLQLADDLIYDVRPEITDIRDYWAADEKPTEAVKTDASRQSLKAWILPTGNRFISNPSKRYQRPDGNPGGAFPFVQPDFDDSGWEVVDLPHDWAIQGPFVQGWGSVVGGGMGRLPNHGVAWYRKRLDIPASDSLKSIYLEVEGAMSYAMVWVNGTLAGGWPYGYASWSLDLSPYIVPGGENQLAIRLDNPPNSSRWYTGGGIYRNVWLTKTHQVHVGLGGTFIHTPEVSKERATIHLEVSIENRSKEAAEVKVVTELFEMDAHGDLLPPAVAQFDPCITSIASLERSSVKTVITLKNPKLWGPLPGQIPHMYKAVTTLYMAEATIDRYETPFGIRSLRFDPDSGIFVNGQHVFIQGVNQHHDLGALGAAFNKRAAERQLEVLQEMGCNSVRMAHNPPAPELLDLTDRMGILVVNEIFDCWERKKAPLDFHLIFPEWHEQDVRAFIERDRNHPSVIMWSLGNEVGEQYTGEAGMNVAEQLHTIAKDADPTRPTTISLNYAKPPMGLPGVMDIISLNYQGEGIRDAPAYKHLRGIRTTPLYPSFHAAHPDKLIVSSENASTLSTRGAYLFPVYSGICAPVEEGKGSDPVTMHVSGYELYTAPFGASPDKVFRSLDQHPFVGGGFVWSGWDYLGEPTPYYLARSSYSGIIDLAGFRKDRYYLYQARWRPDLPMVHILPHWNWPGRTGMNTPVHIFTSGDEAELFLNGRSLGRKKMGPYAYRLRWDDVLYEPGELKAVAYKNGMPWAEQMIQTTGAPASLVAEADRDTILANGQDLSFVTVQVIDKDLQVVPLADNFIQFTLEGPGEIIATDNGDPTDFTPFPSNHRNAFNGLVLAIVRSHKNQPGKIILHASSPGIEDTSIQILSQ
jgi:beta-galactosidase